jgi:O-acetyl-ADP-ribose deacetylase (regulator of RNase III)
VINYVQGDATRPIGEGPKLICHIVNSIGAWGAGFVLALSRRWPQPEAAYRGWYLSRNSHPEVEFGMGNIQTVVVAPELTVINMIAQHGIGKDSHGNIPLRYNALTACLHKVARLAQAVGASVHMPRIGCGLAGGDWEMVEEIIYETLIESGIKVTVYDFGG